MGSSFTVSSAWRVAAPASDGLPPVLPIVPVHAPPPAATSVDALTTPVGPPVAPYVSQPPPGRLLGSRAKLLLAAAATLVAVAIFAVVLTSAIGDAPKRAASAVPSASASSPPVAVAAPAPAPTPAPAPGPTTEPAPAPLATAVAAPPPTHPVEATLVVECTPECASITVDGQPSGSTATLKPGAHVVVVKRGLHGPQTKYVTLAAGRSTTVSFIWWKTPPGPPRYGAPKKPCGKFLQRCD
jgi:hypothetical protein